MSGGTLTDHQYDEYRLESWAENIRGELGKNYLGKEVRPYLTWMANLLVDLRECLYNVDRTLSGDSADERAIKAITEFRQKWYQGVGPTMGDLIDIGVSLENALNRVEVVKERAKQYEPDKLEWHGLKKTD